MERLTQRVVVVGAVRRLSAALQSMSPQGRRTLSRLVLGALLALLAR
ncbi:hypothetical protein AAS68_001246 [Escherichia coli]|nr:hypothetical protein [Escherichia coli]